MWYRRTVAWLIEITIPTDVENDRAEKVLKNCGLVTEESWKSNGNWCGNVCNREAVLNLCNEWLGVMTALPVTCLESNISWYIWFKMFRQIQHLSDFSGQIRNKHMIYSLSMKLLLCELDVIQNLYFGVVVVKICRVLVVFVVVVVKKRWICGLMICSCQLIFDWDILSKSTWASLIWLY